MGGYFFTPKNPPSTSMGQGQPWREMPKDKKDDLDFVKKYKLRRGDVKHLRILLHGPVGAGKSSFLNSVESCLRGQITQRAFTDATSGSSFTSTYKTYKIEIEKSDNFYPFVFNDTMGLESGNDHGVHLNDIKLAMKGHVRDNYKFTHGTPMPAGDKHYNPCPTLDDKVHVVVFVVDAGKVSLISDEVVKKMKDVRLAACDLGIPQLAILTHIDEACPIAKKNLPDVYTSQYLKQQVDKLSQYVGLPPSCIFLVKNYRSAINTNDYIDSMILSTLRQIINHGEDFLNNLEEN